VPEDLAVYNKNNSRRSSYTREYKREPF